MSSFNRLRVGKAGTPADTTGRPSQDNNLAGVIAYPPVEGAPTTQQSVYNIVPLTKQAANVAASQTPAGAGALVLTAGTGATNATIGGNAVIALDCARCLAIVGQGGVTQRNYTISGYDDNQQPMTQTLAGPNGAQTINTTKAFRYIKSITVSGGTAAAITIGTSDTLGLPMRVNNFEEVQLAYNGGAIAANTGFTGADGTSPATATTGDVRGTYALQSASDGVKRFTAFIALLNTDTVDQVWGVAQV